jgi:hypothetical protein
LRRLEKIEINIVTFGNKFKNPGELRKFIIDSEFNEAEFLHDKILRK